MNSAAADRAHLLLGLGHHVRSLTEARRARAEDPDDLLAIAVEALALSCLDRHEEAVQAADELAVAAPNAWWAHSLRSSVLRAASQPDAAVAAAEAALALAPDNADAWISKAASHLDREDLDDALEASDQALALDPESSDAELARGYALLGLKRRLEAEASFRSVLALNPEDARAHTAIARTDFLGARFGAAAEGLRNSLQIDANDRISRQLYVESLRARTVPGRILYSWALLLDRFPRWGQIALLVGLYLTVQVLVRGAILPVAARIAIAAVWVLFCILTWFGPRIVDLYLRMHPRTRQLLADLRDEARHR